MATASQPSGSALQVSLLGHASLVVEGGGSSVLVDPVFSDPFQDGLVVSCPQRRVQLDALPKAGALVLSHGHLDHVHAPSLQRLDRHLRTYIPDDRVLHAGLLALGFADICVVKAWDSVELPGFTILFTPSCGPAQELGMLFHNVHGAVWNMVDTVVDQATCVRVLRELSGKLDVALCAYRPLLEYAGVWVDEVEFPQARYERLLEVALGCQARLLVPSSAGLRCADDNAWANHRVFPVSREQFCQDVSRLDDTVRTQLVNPGQALSLHRRTCTVVDTPYAQTVAMDEERVSFDPQHHPVPPHTDPNPRGYPDALLRQVVDQVVEHAFAEAFTRALTWSLQGPLRTLWDRRAVLQMDVAFPNHHQSWHLTRWAPAQWQRGPATQPDYVWKYRASDAVALVRGEPVRPVVRAHRRQGPALDGRLGALDPARLHGADVYQVVDESFEWNPLGLLFSP